MLDKGTEKRVLEFIANTKEPVHSTEIANTLGINRVTATKYLSVLESKGLVSFKNLGMAKVWMPVENPVLLAFERNDESDTTIQTFNALADGVCVLDKSMEIVWVNKAMEKRHGSLEKLRGKKCHTIFHEEKEICGNCPTKRTFSEGKKQFAIIKKKGFDIEISTSPLKDPKGRVGAVIEIVRVAKKSSEGKRGK